MPAAVERKGLIRMVDISKLKSPLQWGGVRSEVEACVRAVLGKIPEKRIEVQVKTADEIDGPGYTRRRINYFVDEWTRASAWLFVPSGKEEVPGILCCHQQVRQGKDEPAGIEGDPALAFARRYAEMGYVTLAPDCITAGERTSNRLAPYDTKAFYKDNPKLSFLGKCIADHMHALDVFNEVSRVDSARIGVVGHGLGATNALLLAAFDERVLACVASCGFTRFEKDNDVGRWARDEGLVLLPGLRPAIESGEFPFDWEHILSLAAPSALLVLTTLSDSEYSNPKSCQKAVTEAAKVYRLLGAASALDHFTHHDGHRIVPETLEVADDWFERWL